jgi:protein transport protein DSL1/ZW10
MVARDEGHLAVTSNTTANQDWDSAWDSDKDENNVNGEEEVAAAGNRHSFEEAQRVSEVDTPSPDEDVDDDAWGWGNDDIEPVAEISEPEPTTTTPETRQLTLSEKYWTSSLPQAVLDAVVGIYNDGAKLTHPESENVPVTLAAPGLFGLPTLILALYRATSPHYYTKEPGGNMYVNFNAPFLLISIQESIF